MKSKELISCFKAYDIRGRLGSEFNEEIAYKVGYAVGKKFKASKVVIGFDARASSKKIAKSTIDGLHSAGVDILELGLAGTEEVYSAVVSFEADAGIEITASHNPIEYNGMKLVKYGSKPLTEKEFLEIKSLVEEYEADTDQNLNKIYNIHNDAQSLYINKLVEFIDVKNLKSLKIVVNSGNGAAGPAIDRLENTLSRKGLNTKFIKINHNPDSSFPNGIPNPLLPENHFATSRAVRFEKADLGIAFDGDFDRCFFFDHLGNFVPSEYLVGLLAEIFLTKEAGSTIIHDTRIIWNTQDIVRGLNGKAKISKAGHTFFKQEMRKENAIYGGEISAHHYFRDFSFCDSGILPFLLIWELLSKKQQSLYQLIWTRKKYFPSSGEINFNVSDPDKCLEMLKNDFISECTYSDFVDGVSLSFGSWRFNVRKSNTEALVRLNVETKGDMDLLSDKTQYLAHIISSH